MKKFLLTSLMLFGFAGFAPAQTINPGLPTQTPGLIQDPFGKFGKFGKLPDLIITGVKVLDSKVGPHGTKAKVYIKNIGNAPAKNCTLAVKVLTMQGAVQGLHFANVPPLAPGASIGVLIETGPHFHPRQLRFYVDSAGVVLESNEKNNIRMTLVP